MTLENIYFIASIMAAIGVIISLIFVGLQVRQSTATTRAASHHAISESLNALNFLFANNEEVSALFLRGLEDRAGLTPVQKWRVDAVNRAYFHVCETMYFQASLGTGDGGILIAEKRGMMSLLAAPGMQNWWKENLFGFDEGFRHYVEDLLVQVIKEASP